MRNYALIQLFLCNSFKFMILLIGCHYMKYD